MMILLVMLGGLDFILIVLEDYMEILNIGTC